MDVQALHVMQLFAARTRENSELCLREIDMSDKTTRGEKKPEREERVRTERGEDRREKDRRVEERRQQKRDAEDRRQQERRGGDRRNQ